MSKSREQLNTILSQIDIDGLICLDVGVQDKPTSRLTHGKPKEYYTLDIDPQWQSDFVADLNESLFIGRKEDRSLTITNSGLEVFSQAQTKMDVIFCIEVLEHCWNPIQAIVNMRSFLNPGGSLYISTPFINPHHDVVDFLRYTDEWYEKVLPMIGLDIVEIQERKATAGLPELQAFYAKEGLKYSKIRAKIKPYTYPIGYFVHAKVR